ncbi:MAG TPA: hemolysin III family protein [Rhodopila sp.]|jgi:hemolysin III|nr:hemolysin III family protein [Rhodopila sp.]
MTVTTMMSKSYGFPRYDREELLADWTVHLIGTLLALGGVTWLISSLPPDASIKLTASIWIYGFGLLCMLSASALYNMVAAGRMKAKLRRLDHAMIFLMIAASYTPFALIAFPEFSGRLLLAIIWSLAIAGVILKFTSVPHSGFWSVGLYIGMGWVIIGFLPVLISSVAEPSLLLLLLGGIVYSAGALVHAWGGFRFHNAIWHAMVLTGAALHFAAIALLV